jgi:hypothetical protein
MRGLFWLTRSNGILNIVSGIVAELFMTEQELYGFLTSLPKSDFANELDFLSTAVPQFFSILGYQPSQIFFQASLLPDLRHRVDAIVASDRVARPWVIVETKVSGKTYRRNWKNTVFEWEAQIHKYRDQLGWEYAILFTPMFLVVYKGDQRYYYDHSDLSLDQTRELIQMLSAPSALPKSQSQKRAPQQSSSDEFDVFRIDIIQYSSLWEATKTATTNEAKGKTLERLANLVFEGMPFLVVKYRNLRTSSSEIDLVLQYKGWDRPTLFDDFGRYVLVECKNWGSPIAAKQVRDFIGKMRKTRVSLGVIFAKNGITGAHSGVDALRELHSAFDQDNIYVIIVSEEDLEAVKDGISFYDILDTKVDQLRFDL